MKDHQKKREEVEEGPLEPDEESDYLVRLFIRLLIRLWNDLHPPLHPPLMVLHPPLHPTLHPALKWSEYRERENFFFQYSKLIKTVLEDEGLLYNQNPKIIFLHGSLLNVRVALSSLSTLLIKQTTVYNWNLSTWIFIKRPCSSHRLSTLMFKQTSVHNSYRSSRFFN